MNSQSHSPCWNMLQLPFSTRRVPFLTFMTAYHTCSRSATSSSVSCNSSFTDVYNYGTVDHESREARSWRSLYRQIATMKDPNSGSSSVLNWWERQGRKMSAWELRRVIKELRKFRRFKLALEVYDWILGHPEGFKTSSSDIAIQLDLISKVNGTSEAEEFFWRLPENSRNAKTYGALLNAYVHANMKDNAETVMAKMRSEGYLSHPLPFNDIMTLYMRANEFEKVEAMIEEMKRNKVALDVYSYNIWITTCATMTDLAKMEEVFAQMKLDKAVIINWTTYATLAAMYLRCGQLQKAETCLMEIERRISGRDKTPYNHLISLYANIHKKEEVCRVWNSYRASFDTIPNSSYHSMISSLVRMGDINGAEEIYKEWESNRSSYDPRICNVLLSAYVREGMLEKAEGLFTHVHRTGQRTNPNTWEILSEGFIKVGEISKAIEAMKEATSIRKLRLWQPKPRNILSLVALCEERGDAANIALLVEILKKVNCLDSEAYNSLIRISSKAGTPSEMALIRKN